MNISFVFVLLLLKLLFLILERSFLINKLLLLIFANKVINTYLGVAFLIFVLIILFIFLGIFILLKKIKILLLLILTEILIFLVWRIFLIMYLCFILLLLFLLVLFLINCLSYFHVKIIIALIWFSIELFYPTLYLSLGIKPL